MKKNQILALGAVALFTISCNGGGGSISTNVKLENAIDTLTYAYGVEVADKGLSQYLSQLGVLQDTAQFRGAYEFRIQEETDLAKKATLQKELTVKMDSVNKANKKNLADFLSGMSEAVKADKSKSAYLRGIEVGNQINQMSENISKQVFGEDSKETLNKNLLLAGVVTSLKKETPLFENSAVIVETKMQEIQQARAKKEFASQIEGGEKFLAENKTKEGVTTLPDGLQYKVIKAGSGAKPTVSDRVKVHYHGTLLDGTVFDSSVQRGEPTTFGVGQVIRGWTEALQLMPVGSKWVIYIPLDLAYGEREAGSIPPFSTLVFEVELLEIEAAPLVK